MAGFEPAASWTRTMRDTKLRHTPIDRNIIMIIFRIVKYRFENGPIIKKSLMQSIYLDV